MTTPAPALRPRAEPQGKPAALHLRALFSNSRPVQMEPFSDLAFCWLHPDFARRVWRHRGDCAAGSWQFKMSATGSWWSPASSFTPYN